MTDKFRISLRHQLKSFEKGLITFALVFVVGIICGLFEVFDINDFPIFLLTCFLFSIPACYLHITYLIENWGTTLTVDKGQREFRIKTRSRDFNYTYDDIESIELHLGIYYKNGLDQRGRRPAPWTNYGYLLVKLKDGGDFFFTSMMLDLDKLPLPEAVTKFRAIPYISRSKTS